MSDTPTPARAPDKVLSFTMSVELPCGCTIQCNMKNTFPGTINAGNIRAVNDSNSSMFAHWFEHRAPKHRCDLVTEENPSGLDLHRAVRGAE